MSHPKKAVCMKPWKTNFYKCCIRSGWISNSPIKSGTKINCISLSLYELLTTWLLQVAQRWGGACTPYNVYNVYQRRILRILFGEMSFEGNISQCASWGKCVWENADGSNDQNEWKNYSVTAYIMNCLYPSIRVLIAFALSALILSVNII